MAEQGWKIVKYYRSGGGYYPSLQKGYVIKNIITGNYEINARGNVRFFTTVKGAILALKKLRIFQSEN